MIAVAHAPRRPKVPLLEPGMAVRLAWPGHVYDGLVGVVSVVWGRRKVGVKFGGVYFGVPAFRLARVEKGGPR